jgi:Na+/melibiose symporter-like transporter
MNPTVINYALYIILAVFMTIWVARNLQAAGQVFLVDCFRGNAALADSVNRLLVVGFYLINIGFISLYLKTRAQIDDEQAIFEVLSEKMGVVLLTLGGMHFFNLFLFSRIRRRALLVNAPPPLMPQERVTVYPQA